MSATVLFVDDEVRILAAIKRMLRQENYKKIFVSRAIEALEIIEKEPVQVLVTDLRMPEMDGLALIRKVKEKRPEIVCIILTAYSQVPTLLAAINQGDVFRYLTKPWNSEEDFKKVIQEAMYYELAIITTPVFGIVEQVKDNTSALYYQPGDIDTLRQHLIQLSLDEKLREKISSNAKVALDILPTLEEMSTSYEDVFKEAWLSGESR